MNMDCSKRSSGSNCSKVDSDDDWNDWNYLKETVNAKHQHSIYETYRFVSPRQVV